MRTTNDLPDGIRQLVIEGRIAWRERDYETARTHFEEALRAADAADDRFAQIAALHFLGNVAFNQCRDSESRELHLRALSLAQADGDDHGIATSLGGLALVDVAEGDFESAGINYTNAADAYVRAGMAESAQSVREALRLGRRTCGGAELMAFFLAWDDAVGAAIPRRRANRRGSRSSTT
jgi:tetratricopeptide (TPR) repeat protein